MKFDIEKRTASGIYKIVNNVSGKIYIGSAYNLYNRYRVHKSKLITGKHDNDHLQKSFNAHGETSFTFSLIEYCDKTQLAELELQYIDRHYGDMCYNMNKIPQPSGMNARYIKTIALVSPNNTLYQFTGTIRDIANELCQKHDINDEEYVYHGILRLLSKKSKHFIGWRLIENDSYDWKAPIARRYHHKKWDVKLVAPDGIVHGPIENLEKFCKLHGIGRSSDLLNLIKKRTRYINGWYLEGETPTIKNSRTYNLIIEDENGNQYGPITNLTEFARLHSVSQSALRQFIVGTRPRYKNWKIIKPLENNDE